MTEKKTTTKGRRARQSKENKKTPIVINLGAGDLYEQILLAKQKAGANLGLDERVYLWSKDLEQHGITIKVGAYAKAVKPSWLRQLSRWIKSLANKF